MTLKQQDVKNEDDGSPRRAFYRFITQDELHHITVSCDWRKKEAVVSVQEDRAYGGMRNVGSADFDLPERLGIEDAERVAEGFYGQWKASRAVEKAG